MYQFSAKPLLKLFCMLVNSKTVDEIVSTVAVEAMASVAEAEVSAEEAKRVVAMADAET